MVVDDNEFPKIVIDLYGNVREVDVLPNSPVIPRSVPTTRIRHIFLENNEMQFERITGNAVKFLCLLLFVFFTASCFLVGPVFIIISTCWINNIALLQIGIALTSFFYGTLLLMLLIKLYKQKCT